MLNLLQKLIVKSQEHQIITFKLSSTKNERRYAAGKLSDSQIWIYGDIRSGRPVEKRCLLINKFVEGVSKIANVPKTDVWVFLNNLEGSDISEWGVILPESGGESEWFNSLPKELQEKLNKLS